MKRHLKLIILIFVLVVLVSAYFIYTASVNGDSTEENGAEDTSVISVLSMYSNEISSIKYEFEEKQVSLIKKNSSWKWAEDVEFPLNSVYPDSMASALSDITALRLISEDSSKYGEYGLDEPSFEVSFETVDGAKYVYSIGNHNSVTNGYYFKLNNSNKVYLSESGASIKSPFEYGVFDMMQTESFPTVKYENIKKLEYVTQGKKQTITKDKGNADFFADIYSYFLVDEKGNTFAADGKNVAEMLVAVADLELEKCEYYKPDSTILEKMGFSEDKRIDFTLTYDEVYEDNSGSSNINVSSEKTYVFSLGIYEDEETKAKVYCIREKDTQVVYSLSASVGEKLSKALEAELESKYVCPVPAEMIESFTLALSGKTYSKTADELKNDSAVSDLYNKLTSLISDGKAEKAKGKLYLKAGFKIGDNNLELNVYEYDDKYCVASFDKLENMLVSAESIKTLAEAVS